MSGETVAANIKKYERGVERAKRFGWIEYTEHLETIVKELKAIQELDKRFRWVAMELNDKQTELPREEERYGT